MPHFGPWLFLQLEEDDWIDTGPTSVGVVIIDPPSDEPQVELGLEVAVDVALGNEGFQRDSNRFVKAAGFGGAEHRADSRKRQRWQGWWHEP
jgi:hypothetical protein